MKALFGNVLLLALVVHGTAVADDAKKLRLITWADYAPADVIAQFKQETGIQVEVTLSNNEEIISKLDEAGKTFHILVLKTTLTIPYTSVFIRLECGYWGADAEKRLREAMASH